MLSSGIGMGTERSLTLVFTTSPLRMTSGRCIKETAYGGDEPTGTTRTDLWPPTCGTPSMTSFPLSFWDWLHRVT